MGHCLPGSLPRANLSSQGGAKGLDQPLSTLEPEGAAVQPGRALGALPVRDSHTVPRWKHPAGFREPKIMRLCRRPADPGSGLEVTTHSFLPSFIR